MTRKGNRDRYTNEHPPTKVPETLIVIFTIGTVGGDKNKEPNISKIIVLCVRITLHYLKMEVSINLRVNKRLSYFSVGVFLWSKIVVYECRV